MEKAARQDEMMREEMRLKAEQERLRNQYEQVRGARFDDPLPATFPLRLACPTRLVHPCRLLLPRTHQERNREQGKDTESKEDKVAAAWAKAKQESEEAKRNKFGGRRAAGLRASQGEQAARRPAALATARTAAT